MQSWLLEYYSYQMQEVMPFAVITEQRSYNKFATVNSIQHMETLETHRRCLSHQLKNSLLDQTNTQEVSHQDFEEKACEKYTRPYLDLNSPQKTRKTSQPVKILSVQKIKERISVNQSRRNFCERGKKKGPGISIFKHYQQKVDEKLVKIQMGGCSVESSKPKPKHKRIWLSKDFLQL